MNTPPVEPADDVRRVLVITAHPDDVDFGSAGTVASWTSRGVEVAYCVCTSGEAGSVEDTPRAEVPRLRQEEQRAAAKAVGVTDVTFLDYRDGEVTVHLRLRRDITEIIRTVRPDLVVTHSPEINWEHPVVSHPDHRAVGEATLAAVYPDARNEFAHPELLERDGLQPWTVRRLWLSESPPERLDHAVDITEHFEAKVAALRAHHSQTVRIEDLEGMLRRHLRANAERHGLGPERLAEAFQTVDTA